MTAGALVEARDLSKSFGRTTAVAGVSLTVRPGEIVGLLGANGAGKTTVIRMLLGLETPSSGEIGVLGTAPWRADRHRIGYVAQGLGLYTELSVQQNIDFVAAAFGVASPPEPPPGLAAVRQRQVRSIGLGRQRQLAFYCALVHAPALLVLDEPTSGVDPLARARLWDTIHEQAAADVGVLVTTHHLQEAEQCTRLTIMSRGRAVAEGSAAEITGGRTAVVVTSPRWQHAFTALTDAGFAVGLHGRAVRVAGAQPAAVEQALDAAGVRATVAAAPATLEETMVLIDRDTVEP